MKRKAIIFCILFLLLRLLYIFPLQENINLYINEQGADKENTMSSRFFYNYKMDSYVLAVIYSDDPNYEYYYEYSRKRTEYSYKIFCSIYNDTDTEIGVTGEKVKYPKLDKLY